MFLIVFNQLKPRVVAGCNLQPHYWMELNPTHWFFKGLMSCFSGYYPSPCVRNTLSLPKRPGATLGQGPVACSWDAPRLLQLHKRTQRAFN